MVFRDFDGVLDGEQPGKGFVDFTGELDAPEKRETVLSHVPSEDEFAEDRFATDKQTASSVDSSSTPAIQYQKGVSPTLDRMIEPAIQVTEQDRAGMIEKYGFAGAGQIQRKVDDYNAESERQKIERGQMPSLRVPDTDAGVMDAVSGLAKAPITDLGKQGATLFRMAGQYVAGEAIGNPEIQQFGRDVDLAGKHLFDKYSNREKREQPEYDSTVARGVYSGLRSLEQMVIAMIAAGPKGALAYMTAGQVGLPAVGEAMDKNIGLAGSVAYGSGQGVIEYVTEKLPMGYLLDKFGKDGAAKFIRGFLARELPGELVATTTQNALEQAVLHPEKTWASYFNELPQQLLETGIAVGTMGGVIGGAHAGYKGLSNWQAENAADRAKQHALDAWSSGLATNSQPAPTVEDIATAQNLDTALATAEAALAAPIETSPTIEDIEGTSPAGMQAPQWTAKPVTTVGAPSLESTPFQLPQGIINAQSAQAIESQSTLQEVPQAAPETGGVQDQLIPPTTNQGESNALQVQRQEAAQEVNAPQTTQGTLPSKPAGISVQSQATKIKPAPDQQLEAVPAAAQKGEVAFKKGVVTITGSSTLDVRHALQALNLPFVAEQKNGKIVIKAQVDKQGRETKITIRQKNEIRDQLFGREIAQPKKRTATGNLRNDLNLLYPKLWNEVEKGGDGEATGKLDLGAIAEELRDEYGYSQIGNHGDSKAAGEALVDMIRSGGAVNEERMLAEKTENDEKARRSEVRRVAEEYGIEFNSFTPFAKIESEVETVLESEMSSAMKAANEMYAEAIAFGAVTEAEADAIVDRVAQEYDTSPARDKDVTKWRSIADELQDKINEQIERQSEVQDSREDQGATEEAGAREERPTLELEQQTEADLKAKTDRENDQALADKETADAQREAFTLSAPEGPAAPKAVHSQQGGLFGATGEAIKTKNNIETNPEKPDNSRRDNSPQKTAPKGAVSVSAFDIGKVLDQARGKKITQQAVVKETGQLLQLKDQEAEPAIVQIRNDIQALEALRLCIGG